MTSHVLGYFYGGLMNPTVMQRVGMTPRRQEVAILPGFDLTIAPLVNLVRSPSDCVYGVLMELTHAELQHVYGQLKATYLPYPVVACDLDGRMRAALCYIVPEMEAGPAEAAHVEALLEPASKLGFPEWYLEKIRGFLPAV